jgi:hypothetical protein
MDRYLTLEECAEELRVTKPVIKKLLKLNRLVGIEITHGVYRILAPSPRLRESLIDKPLERTPFLTMREAAEILGMTPSNLKWYVETGKAEAVHIEGGPHFKVFTVNEIRRLAATREKRSGPGRLLYSISIYKWLRMHIKDDLEPKTAVIAELLEQTVKLPEPRRSEVIVQLWGLFDRVNELLEECSRQP